jgi:single-strand DNA-binding protein
MFMNRIILAGFVGADARHLATQKGKQITRFTLATSKRYREGREWKERTQWHECVIYGESPRDSEDAIQKGAHLLIEGAVGYREYDRTIETEQGPIKVKWPITEVIVHSITPLDRQSESENGAA